MLLLLSIYLFIYLLTYLFIYLAYVGGQGEATALSYGLHALSSVS